MQQKHNKNYHSLALRAAKAFDSVAQKLAKPGRETSLARRYRLCAAFMRQEEESAAFLMGDLEKMPKEAQDVVVHLIKKDNRLSDSVRKLECFAQTV